VPAEIARIAYWNKRAAYGLLFRASAQTVSIIAADLKRLGARVGMTSVLHTWGSALTHHPHVHMIVSGGGLSRLFRRLFIEGLLALHHADELTFFGDLLGLSDPQAFSAYLAPLRKIECVVIVPEARLRHDAKPPFGGSEAVLASSKRKVDIAKVRTLLGAQPPPKLEDTPAAEVVPLTLREPGPDCGGALCNIETFRRGQKPQSRAPPQEAAA